MILEGIVTSQNSAGALNIAPMGPIVDESLTWLHLRPFQTSTTFRNLKETGCGVFHVVDDVLLIAQAALNRLPEFVPTQPAEKVPAGYSMRPVAGMSSALRLSTTARTGPRFVAALCIRGGCVTSSDFNGPSMRCWKPRSWPRGCI